MNQSCPNCGAPVTTEICPYCNNFTGLDTKSANMDYPVINCREAHINFMNTGFPLIFSFAFGIVPLITIVPIILTQEMLALPFLLGDLVFLIIGGVAGYIAFNSFNKKSKIKKYGKDIEATVYGYMNDNMLINGYPAQIVKLLVQTDEGPRFILYQLGDIKKPYKINSRIRLKVYKDIFAINEEDKKYYFENQ